MSASMTDDPGGKLTARDVLCGDLASLPEALEQAISVEQLRESLPPGASSAASKFLVSQAAIAIDRILAAIDVDQVLMGGWMQLDELRAAIVDTATDRSSRHIALASHNIASEHTPSLELTINQTPVKLLDLALNLGFTLDACELVVDSGEVIRVEVGSLNAHGELKASDRTIIQRDSNRLDTTRIFTSLRPAR